MAENEYSQKLVLCFFFSTSDRHLFQISGYGLYCDHTPLFGFPQMRESVEYLERENKRNIQAGLRKNRGRRLLLSRVKAVSLCCPAQRQPAAMTKGCRNAKKVREEQKSNPLI